MTMIYPKRELEKMLAVATDPEQIAAIQQSLRESGWVGGIAADNKGGFVGGTWRPLFEDHTNIPSEEQSK